MQEPKNICCRPMTRWQSHKIVQADKITHILDDGGESTVTITLGDEADAPVIVVGKKEPVEGQISWYEKHQPKVGDYLVIYEDDYMSVSPAEAFEKGYRNLTTSQPGGHSFGEALEALKQGKRVARAGWNGKGMWLSLQVPDAHSKMTLPYIYIEYPELHVAYPNGSRVPWLASQTDMLSDDWEILD